VKKQLYLTIATILVAGSLGVSAMAQCANMNSTANIPFQFSAGETTLPAGQYSISCLNAGSGLPLILISGERSKVVMQTTPRSGKAKEEGSLVFHRYGDRYFLAQMWAAGDEMGLALPGSRAESQLKRELAGTKPKEEFVALNRSQPKESAGQ